MSKFLLLPLALLLAGFWNLDVVDARYATRAESEARDSGGLPPILPGSAHDIHTVNDHDLNTSRGGFEFSDTDAGGFFARLSLDVPEQAPFEDWSSMLADYRGSGHVAWSYREEGSIWVFLCDPSEDACDYLRWTSREWKRKRLALAKQGDTRHGPQ